MLYLADESARLGISFSDLLRRIVDAYRTSDRLVVAASPKAAR